MKILMVAIPNHHFFQWVNQLENFGFDVFWFDATDGGPKSDKINWVNQIKGWKLKWDFPFRTSLKKNWPKLYCFLQRYNENNVSKEFEKVLQKINPDIVHCFEMKLTGIPILSVMEQNMIPLIYSSWGSDMFNFHNLGVSKQETKNFLHRTNYLITDCKRDYNIAKKNGFNNKFLGVFPGNGGLQIDVSKIKSLNERSIILIKGYEDGIGKASVVLKALELVKPTILKDKCIIIYSADLILESQIKSSKILSKLPITFYSRYNFVTNYKLLELMGESCIYIGNSISDGLPNGLLEAMAMGAFPIQSNPGNVTEEIVKNGENGFLIQNPLDEKEISQLIENSLNDKFLRKNAQDYNVNFIDENYNRNELQAKIVKLYNTILN